MLERLLIFEIAVLVPGRIVSFKNLKNHVVCGRKYLWISHFPVPRGSWDSVGHGTAGNGRKFSHCNGLR